MHKQVAGLCGLMITALGLAAAAGGTGATDNRPVLTNAAPPAPGAIPELTAGQRSTERAKRLSAVPEAKAAYIFEATRARPGWAGMAGVSVKSNYFGKGIHGLSMIPDFEGRTAYWRMEDIKPGDYYMGLWTESGARERKTEYGPMQLLATAYVNGWPVRFETAAEPVQVKPGVWLTELQTGGAVSLKPGDEVSYAIAGVNKSQNVLRLALHRRPPRRGHGMTGRTFGMDIGVPQRVRLVPNAEILGSGKDGEALEARIEIANPLSFETDVDVIWRLADHFGTPVTGRTDRVRIAPHQTAVITHPFMAAGDSCAYQLDVRTRPGKGFVLPVPRPVEWLVLNDWTRMEFLPDQPHPLVTWRHVRRELIEDRSGSRQWQSLDGADWEAAWLDGRRVPDTVPGRLAFKGVSVPVKETWIKPPEGRFGRWFRKSFRVPEWMRGERFMLVCPEVPIENTLYLNGRRLNTASRSGLPLWVDVTGALRSDGDNELVVLARNGIALVKPDFVDQFDLKNAKTAMENQDIYGRLGEVPLPGSFILQTVPTVRVKQGLVLSDVEKKRIRVLTRIENGGAAPRVVTLRHEVEQGGRPVGLELPSPTVTVPARGVTEVAVEASARGLTPWSREQPVLAKLTTVVEADGTVLDLHAHRFGYRSLRVEGTGFLLNGKPARLQGGFQHYPHNIYEMEDDIDVSRDAHAGRGIDLYDEIGNLHYRWIGHAWSATWKQLNNAAYWDSLRSFAVESVWEVGSHPCIIGWDISNESFHYAGGFSGAEGQARHGELIASVAEAVRARFQSDFWFLADGDEDLGGRLDFCSFHYLNHGQLLHGFMQQPGTFGYYDGVAHYPPDLFFLNGAANVPKPGTVLALRPDWRFGSNACGDTETFWFGNTALGMCKYIGDAAAVATAGQFYDPRGMAWTKMAIEGYRDMEMVFFGGMYWKSFLGLVSRDVAFEMPEQEIRYYGGTKFDRRLNLHDASGRPGRLTFEWQLSDAAGGAVAQDRLSVRSNTDFIRRTRVAFKLPDVRTRTEFTLRMELWKEGLKCAGEERTVEVWPRFSPPAESGPVSRIVVFDPSNTVLPVLARYGVTAKSAMTLDLAALQGAQALIIGPDCVTPELANKQSVIRDYVQAGGRVLLLHQESAALLPVEAMIEKKAWVSMGFVRTANHPVLRGLKDRDFQMWNPGHLIARGAYRKPDKGSFLTLVDSGQDGTMAWSELIEFYIGRGSVVGCQLPLLEQVETEPMAGELLWRLIAYLEQPVYKTPRGRLAVLAGAGEPVLNRLAAVRAAFEIVGTPGSAFSSVLVDLGAASPPPPAAGLKAYVENGGTLLLHRARPEHREWLEGLLGRPVQMAIQPYAGWADRQMMETRGGLMEGLNHTDFYWRSLIAGEAPDSTCQVSSGLSDERGQVDYIVCVEGVKDELFPGGLVPVPVGKGRVVIDQLKWEMTEKDLIGSPARVLSMLLTNLGIERRLPPPRPVLPASVRFEPVDLSKVANLAFRDEKAGDGIGWLDNGPAADLRSFPTGRVTLVGTPYLVAGGVSNAVALRGNPAFMPNLKDMPDTVTLPLNRRRVAGLLFLHTGAWAYGLEPFGFREIVYTDGTKVVITLNGANSADWNYGRDNFPGEEGTFTEVAWKGACPNYPVLRVYQTLWINPYPDKEIQQVVLSNKGLPEKQWRFTPHLALTVAMLPAEAAVPVAPAARPRDTAKAQAFLQESLKLAESGKKKEAAATLEAALLADDHHAGVWITLAGLRAESASVEDFTALCRRWMEAMPANYQAHNTLARFLEEKGRGAEALAEYQESLKIEWNQPSVDTAVIRLRSKP